MYEMATTYTLITRVGIFVVGIIAALIVGAIFNHFTKGIKKWAKAREDVGPQFLLAVRVAKLFIQASVLLLFLTQSVSFYGLEVLTQLTQKAALYLPKLLVAGVVVLVGMYLSRIVSKKCMSLTWAEKKNLAVGVEVLILVTFILAALEIAGLQVQVFLETYRVVLYTIGVIVALAVGIPLGVSFAPSIKKLAKK